MAYTSKIYRMKRILPFVLSSILALPLFGQQVIEYSTEVDEVHEPTIFPGSAKKGEEMEFDEHYQRRSGLQVDKATVRFDGRNVVVTPGETNRDTASKTEWWREVGQFFPFSGDARVLGVMLVLKDYKIDGASDNYDISLYRTSDGMPTDVPYGNLVFSGDIISTGPEKDSMTYVEFGSNDITNVYNGFVIGVSIQEVTEFGDEQDVLQLYTNKNGDGKGYKHAMVKIQQSSRLAGRLPAGEIETWLRLDDIFTDSDGNPFKFDYDFMIIPVLDVDVISDERVTFDRAVFKGHFPNPAKESFNVLLNAQETLNNVSVEVLSMGGKVLSTTQFNNLSAGDHQLNVDATNLSSGSYLYTLTVDGKSVTTKVLVQK